MQSPCVPRDPGPGCQIADNRGEWFEVHNPGAVALDLIGLVVRDVPLQSQPIPQTFVVDRSLPIAAGGYLLFAINGNPAQNGGLPAVDFVYPIEFLLFTQKDAVELVSADGGVLIDSVIYTEAAFPPDAQGASMSLDPDRLDEELNDDPNSWCEGVTPYGLGDRGSPGQANPQCPER
jgi:hypothetical protein